MKDYKTGLNISTFEARVLIGGTVGYSSQLLTYEEVKSAVKEAAKSVENYVFSGTITKTDILAVGKGKDYEEPAFAIESSIYPRYPFSVEDFKSKFTEFIGNLAVILKQERVAIRFNDESLMLETKFCQKPDIK